MYASAIACSQCSASVSLEEFSVNKEKPLLSKKSLDNIITHSTVCNAKAKLNFAINKASLIE